MRYSLRSKQQNGVVDSDGRIVWFSSRSPRVRFPLTSLRRDRDATTEVTRPDEDTVLKTAAVKNRCGFESHGFRLFDEFMGAFPHGRFF